MSVTLRKETNLYDDLAIKAVNDKVVSQYAVSTTASSTVAKTATVDGTFELYKNARVSVFFQNANTATSPTLNIAGTGAKPIWAYGGPLSASGNTFNWVANSTIEFVYDGTHWLVADSGAVGLISKYDEKLNQEVVFNKLTNDGSIRGIFMQNGQMYVNMDYLQTGTLKLGGANNGNGLLQVYDSSGVKTGEWNNTSFFTESNVAHFELNAADKKTGNVYTHGSFKMYPKGYSNFGIYFSIAKPNYSPGTNIEITNLDSADNNMIKLNTMESTSSTSPKTVFAICQNDTYFGIGDYNGGSTASGYGSVRHGSLAWGKGCFKLNLQNIYNTSGTPDIVDSSTHRGLYISCSDTNYISNRQNTYSTFKYYGSSTVYLTVDGKNDAIGLRSGTRMLIGNSSSWYTNLGTIAYQSSSSKRYKHDITDNISEELDAHKLYEIKMKQFVFNSDHIPQYTDMVGKTIPGFIAEDVAEIYPAATTYNANGEIESWDERRIIPGMLALIQEQKKQLDEQAERIAKLENQTSFIHVM